MDGVLGSSWGMYCATQAFCRRSGMYRGIQYIVDVCVGVGTCGRR